MTKQYFPFDAGAGANVAEAQWRMMAQYWLAEGPIIGSRNQMLVFGDSSGMNVKVKSGTAWVHGHLFDDDAQETIAISANSSGNPRIDRIVLHADFAANTIDYLVLQGTPGASPVEPSLTQTSTVWEIALANVLVVSGASTINAGDVTDERGMTVHNGTVYGAVATLSGTQSIPDSTGTFVTFDGADFDTSDVAGTSGLTIPWGGIWVVSGGLVFDSNTTGRRRAEIYLNGVFDNRLQASTDGVSSGTTGVPLGSVPIEFVTGDVLKLQAFQDSGGALALNGAFLSAIYAGVKAA